MLRNGLSEDYYDHLYLKDDRTYERPLSSPYYVLYRQICKLIVQAKLRSVLEVGCGSGVLAEMLIGSGMSYTGFDFSPVAVEKAKTRNPAQRFFVGDATDTSVYDVPYDGIVCCEVLEHLEDDLKAVELWKHGALCICSVPNFDYESHVRFFRSEAEVAEHYGKLLDISCIVRVTKSASANLTWAEYFRRIRWARNQPTYLLVYRAAALEINPRHRWSGSACLWIAEAARRSCLRLGDGELSRLCTCRFSRSAGVRPPLW
jgi:2-polyprenyl-3-methyl-5-hydroxy-6-metoxy-1,4-benzoquinol methylase